MKCMFVNWVSVLALLLLPLGGCSSSTDGEGGSGATGGTAGSGGSGGQAGEGGQGGVGGVGGAAGVGGSEATPPGLWTGNEAGASSDALDICFNVNADGTALTVGSELGQPCELWAVEVVFTGDCANGFTTRPDIPIVDGSFELVIPDLFELRGSFDGETASGEATMLTGPPCSGQWEATPSN